MKIEQIYTSCLSEMTYFISDKGEAVIIDPLRDPYPYIRMAESYESKITYIFLTHFHADFVSGHLDLAKRTGATIVCGPNAIADFDFYCAKDNEKFNVGNVTIQLLHTPGHTLESSSYLLIDKDGGFPCVFTGDCLFLDDVGRPDLAVIPGSLTREDLAGMQFDSLRNRIMILPDDIIVYPNHGFGSACGKKMKVDTFDTLGNQKKSNYALKADMTKEEFVKQITDGLTAPPQYFPKNAKLNKSKLQDYDEIIYRATTPISPGVFKRLSEKPEYLLVDTRTKNNVVEYGMIPGALCIGLEGKFADLVGTIIEDIEQKIIFIADDDSKVYEIAARFSRVGYDNVRGYLTGGIYNWKNHGFKLLGLASMSSLDFYNKLKTNEKVNVLDVRNRQEYFSGHLESATSFPLEDIYSNIHLLDKDNEYFLHCNSGYLSLVATSLLISKGFKNIVNINDTIKL